jgi:hypothetical protein
MLKKQWRNSEETVLYKSLWNGPTYFIWYTRPFCLYALVQRAPGDEAKIWLACLYFLVSSPDTSPEKQKWGGSGGVWEHRSNYWIIRVPIFGVAHSYGPCFLACIHVCATDNRGACSYCACSLCRATSSHLNSVATKWFICWVWIQLLYCSISDSALFFIRTSIGHFVMWESRFNWENPCKCVSISGNPWQQCDIPD